jgi:hypothetical protein
MAKASQQQPPDEGEYQEPQYEQEEFIPPEGEVREGEEFAPEQQDENPLPPTNVGPGGPFLDHTVPPQPGTIEDEVPLSEVAAIEGEPQQEEYRAETTQEEEVQPSS